VNRQPLLLFAVLITLSQNVRAQEPAPWRDPSPHKVQFVDVDAGVKLEVLDWGGSGRALVLLAGLGNTAHVFDEFAPKLTSEYHVFGITRRGFGASSDPGTGYSADRLGDDVLAVLDALKLDRPVLVGHSIAGEELSSVATRHPGRVAGLIYLDAAYIHAFYYRSGGASTWFDLNELKGKLEQLKPDTGRAERVRLMQELLDHGLPDFEKDLREMLDFYSSAPANGAPAPAPSPDDLSSFPAFRDWIARIFGTNYPESEVRQMNESKPDGSVGKHLDKTRVQAAIEAGEQKYAELAVPVLAIYANPHDPGPYAFNTPAERAAAEKLEAATIDAMAKAFQAGVPSARVVQIPHANHFVFISNESDVLREMRAFLAGLK
jgi:pimeloyl-ACP methyl ester carboxylesterase